MQIKRLAATFGRLENEILDLEPGLNIIEAPNEAGKSTWTTFLRVMLYGLNTGGRPALIHLWARSPPSIPAPLHPLPS